MADPVAITVTVPDLPVVTDVSVLGIQGSPGIFIGDTAPADTDILWADTSEAGDAVVPQGGTTGQALVKASNADYDTAWGEMTGRLRSAPIVSGGTAVAWVPGSRYMVRAGQNGVATSTLYYECWLVEQPLVLEALQTVCTGLIANADIRIALYAATAKWQPTGAPLADSGTISLGTTGIKTATLVSPLSLAVGRYMIVYARAGGTGNPTVRGVYAAMPTYIIASGTNLNVGNLFTRSDAGAVTTFMSGPQTNPPEWNAAATFDGVPSTNQIHGVFRA